MSHIKATSANALQVRLCQDLLRNGDEASPRGMTTRELLGVSFEIENPRDRMTTLPARKWSPSLAIAEFAWHLRGDVEVEPLAFYAPRWRDFADVDGLVRGSCYGAHIFKGNPSGRSQWGNVRSLLATDLNTRRAVLNFRAEHDVSQQTKDLSCTNTVQFIARYGKLHAFVSMRSNDAIWGVPYDVFLFTCLQELMALELGLDLGRYYHTASSMHVYERHYNLAEAIADGEIGAAGLMPKMVRADSVYALSREEQVIRTTGKRSAELDDFGEFCMRLLVRHKGFSLAA